mgnify:CR=1 FL=1
MRWTRLMLGEFLYWRFRLLLAEGDLLASLGAASLYRHTKSPQYRPTWTIPSAIVMTVVVSNITVTSPSTALPTSGACSIPARWTL